MAAKRKDTMSIRQFDKTVGKDAVVETIRRALRATQAAQKEAYGDVRTSSTVCTDYLDQAASSLESAAKWMADYPERSQG